MRGLQARPAVRAGQAKPDRGIRPREEPRPDMMLREVIVQSLGMGVVVEAEQAGSACKDRSAAEQEAVQPVPVMRQSRASVISPVGIA